LKILKSGKNDNFLEILKIQKFEKI